MKGALLLSGLQEEFKQVKQMILNSSRILFLGCGGSFQSHMAHDYCKMAGIKTLAPEGASLLTCLFNDCKEEAFAKWISVQREPGDLLIVVSSSGNSDVTINAVKEFKRHSDNVVTITGFEKNNRLSKLGQVNIYLDTNIYGVHELMSECFLHAILDSILEERKNGYYKEVIDEPKT